MFSIYKRKFINSKIFNLRAFISLSVFLSFAILLITSLLMFTRQHTVPIAMLHTLVGFALTLLLLWHIKNNIHALGHYLTWRRGGAQARVNIALLAALLLVFALASLTLAQFSPMQSFYQWGATLRSGDKAEQSLQFSYVRIDKTQADALGNKLSIDLRKGSYFMFPQYAIWLETLDGSFIQPLYITQKLAQNNFSNKVTKLNSQQVFTSNPLTSGQNSAEIFQFEADPASAAQRFRPEALPVFLHKLSSRAAEQVFAAADSTPTTPGENSLAAVDAYSGATLLDNFLLSSRSAKPLPKNYRVRLEINQSFDFNDFYSSDRFPDDPVYSGNGYSAQPSVIYEAIIDSDSPQGFYPMQLIGHGHHSGMDGSIYQDMENLTTATGLIDRVIVELDNH